MEQLSPSDPRAVGRYRLFGRLGRGPQGVVFLGERNGDVAAVKLLHARFGGNQRLRARFAHELASAQRINDPGVARVLGAGLERGAPYVVSEFVNGMSLRQVVGSAGPRVGPPLDRLAIGVAGALWAMHRAGIIHRDLRPGNVLLDSGGPRVIDFGYGSVLESAGVRGVLGGPGFRAPEQVSGGEAGSAVDVWAWACLMAYAASGRAPFGEGSIPDVVERIVSGKPDLSGLDGLLGQLVNDALAKEPRSRPSAQQLLLELTGTTAPSARSWPALNVVKPPPPVAEPIQPYLGVGGVQSAPLRPLLVAASVIIPLVVGAAVVRWGITHEPVVTRMASAGNMAIDLKGDFRVKALRAGTVDGRAFADYEMSNLAPRAVDLEMPGELLVRKAALPYSVQDTCATVPSTSTLCGLKTSTVVVERLEGAAAPELRGGTLRIPPRATYVLRVTTVAPVGADLTKTDLGLYVTNPRFTGKPISLPFP